MKQQQAAYEAVRADRNLCSRSLIAAQDEVVELRNRARILVRSSLSIVMKSKKRHLMRIKPMSIALCRPHCCTCAATARMPASRKPMIRSKTWLLHYLDMDCMTCW